MPNERWLAISGYEGIYEVSDYGRVRSLDDPSKGRWAKGRILKALTKESGHLQLGLSKGGVTRPKYVHRLVLESFVGPCPSGMEACHSPDPSPANNRLNNLRWDTQISNVADCISHGRKPVGSATSASKLTERALHLIREMRLHGKTLLEIAEQFGVSKSTIHLALSGKTWRHTNSAIESSARRRLHGESVSRSRRNATLDRGVSQ